MLTVKNSSWYKKENQMGVGRLFSAHSFLMGWNWEEEGTQQDFYLLQCKFFFYLDNSWVDSNLTFHNASRKKTIYVWHWHVVFQKNSCNCKYRLTQRFLQEVIFNLSKMLHKCNFDLLFYIAIVSCIMTKRWEHISTYFSCMLSFG